MCRVLFLLLLLPVATYGSPARPDRITAHQLQLGIPDIADRGNIERANVQFSTGASAADLRISEILSPAHFTQENLSLARTKDNQWIAAWQDERLGSLKIFLQRIDSLGSPSGANQLMAGSNSGADLVDPKLAVDTLGRIHLFYRDKTNGLLFGSRYTGALAVDLAPYLVNDTTNGAFAGLYDVDIYPDGRLVVVWENYDISGNTIKMRIYSNTGGSLIAPATVNSDPATNAHWAPSVAVQPNSGYLIAWEDYRSTDADIYARQYTGAGVAVASEFTIVPPLAADSAQYTPQIVFSISAQYTIGWLDLRAGQEVYLQTFNPTTGLVGGNVLASSGNASLAAWDIDLAIAPNGTLLVIWASYGADISIVSRRFSGGLAPLTGIIELNTGTVGRRWGPSGRFFSANKYGVGWIEFVGEDADIAFMQFDSLGNKLIVQERTLNDDTQGAPASSPAIAAVEDWYDLVLFADRRTDAGDVFLQAVTHNGTLLGPNRKLNVDAGFNLQSEPSIAAGDTLNLALWVDGRAISGVPGQRVFGRFVSDYGAFQSSEFAISDSLSGDGKGMPKAAIGTTGRTLVGWIDYRGSSPQVYGRWLTSSGAYDGAEFLISSPAQDSQIVKLFVGRDALNRFYAVWFDNGRTSPRARGVWFNADKSTGGSFSHSSTVVGASIDDLAASVSDSGEIGSLWTTVGTVTKELYLTVIDRTGAVTLPATLVTDNALSRPSEPTIDFDERGYVTAGWVDRRSGARQIYYRIYDDSYAPLGANQAFSATSPEYMRSPSVAASRGRLWAAWVDPRAIGAAVWGNVIIYLPTDVDNDQSGLPGSFYLSQNYPNPFNPSTEIRFSLPRRSAIRLTVFNLLGQEVTTLTDGEYAAGEYRVRWNGQDTSGESVASGIYFYRLEAGEFSRTRKMVLLK
ncbi:MAG: T9SS type A sorting domain-containing protein [candidate division Zixibacteria bacterium]|nr:T9SS type A sorting domain-containing protein [candidate division Zixibacteria bacterium]